MEENPLKPTPRVSNVESTPEPVLPDPGLPAWRLLRPEDFYMVLYLAFTAVVVVGGWMAGRFAGPGVHLISRAVAIAYALVLVPYAQRRRNDWTALLRDMYYMIFFIFLYTETADLHVGLWGGVSFDEPVAGLDQWLFGYQPALVFPRALPQAWFSEFMNFCYTFYYLLFALGGLVLWLRRDKGRAYGRMLHAVVMTMLFCYVFFILFPTLGPQYRYADQYSRNHMAGYFWKYVLDSILEFGERPTGAFPSSHVALATVFMLSFWCYARRIFWIALPFVAGLFCATVYIGVHYFSDVPAGFLVGVGGWYASERIRWAVSRRLGLYAFSPRLNGG